MRRVWTTRSWWLLLLAAVLLVGCGGDSDVSTDQIGVDSGADEETAAADGEGALDDGSPGDGSVEGESAACPPLGEVLESVNAATYVVYAELTTPGGDGTDLTHFQIGTAWGVDRRLLVTNAHVTQAFVELAEQGVQIERALAIQAGTGEVVELLREITHPDYDGDPLRSPDVGLFTTRDQVAEVLTLAPDDVAIQLGDEVQIVGFPGDVTEFIEIVPGETVPQATSLNGEVTALRAHDDTQQVSAENLDVVQHQAPTTPGTSGSSMVACGQVIGVNNAGTVNLIATPGEDGSLQIDRQAAAANNFAVHVRHIRELIELFDDNALQGGELPVEATPVPNTGGGGGNAGGGNAGGGQNPGMVVLQGEVDEPYPHSFTIQLADDGSVVGESNWSGNAFALAGEIAADGSVAFVDDAAERSAELRRGIYEAVIIDDATLEGVYYEEGDEQNQAPFIARVVG